MLQSEVFCATLLVVLQVCGVLGVLVARLSGCQRRQRCGQVFFFIWMGLTGIGTLAVVHLGCHLWLPMGTTLAVLALGATIDFGKSEVRSPF